jgi:hypothetical protein
VRRSQICIFNISINEDGRSRHAEMRTRNTPPATRVPAVVKRVGPYSTKSAVVSGL